MAAMAGAPAPGAVRQPAFGVGAFGGRRSRCRSGLGFALGADLRQRRADRHLGADVDQEFFDPTGLEALDLDGAFLGLHHRDDVAVLDLIAGLDQPLHQRARLHVGAERGHAEFGHGVSSAFPSPPWRRQRSCRLAGSPRFPDGADRGSAPPRCTRGRAAHRATRTPVRRCACRLPPPGCRCASLRR